jgi:hypothetical protein
MAIEASFAMQYGIRLAKEDMPLGEFLRLLSGIMPDTPLGRLVCVRAETNREIIKNFGAHERKIRAEWASRSMGGSRFRGDDDLVKLQNELALAFGGG